MFRNIYTENLKTAVFDIETTGLSPDSASLISASFCDDDGGGLRQYFCEDPGNEFLLIGKIIEEFRELDAVITYNGMRFDIPFVLSRARIYGIANELPYVWNIDLYQWLKKYWPAAKSMSSLSQSSVEVALGLDDKRTDTIGGAECITLYNQYLAHGDMDAADKILLHNGDDVRQLAAISEKLSFLPFHKIVFENGRLLKIRPSYPGASDISFRLGAVKQDYRRLVIEGSTDKGLPDCSERNDSYHVEYDPFTGLVFLELFVKEMDKYVYVDLNDLPVRTDDYSGSEAFSSGYLILMENSVMNSRDINALIADILKNTVLRDLY